MITRETTTKNYKTKVLWAFFICLLFSLHSYAQCTGIDTDSDGVSDICDLDDDNDGILDVDENTCENFFEDFGTGTYPGAALPAGQTTYNYRGDIPAYATWPNAITDGDYAIALEGHQPNGNFQSGITDHTGGGYMMVVNADVATGDFYNRDVSLFANTDYEFSAWAVNINSASNETNCNTGPNPPYVLPDLKYEIRDLDAGGAVVASYTTGDVPRDNIWHNYTFTFNSGSSTNVQVAVINNGPGGCGNDLAIDDIALNMTSGIGGIGLPCDKDGDGLIDSLDLDSDGDGCPDALEGGDGLPYSSIDSNDRLTGTVNSEGIPNNVDQNTGQTIGTSQDASLQALVCDPCNSGNPNYADNDGDLVADACDLDDDNDGILDTVECGIPGAATPAGDALSWEDGLFSIFGVGNNTNALGYEESGFQQEAYRRGFSLTTLNGSGDYSFTGATGPGSATSSVGTFANGTMTFSTSYITNDNAEFRTTTSGNFISGNTGHGVYVFPEQGGSAGDYYTVTIDFTTPVTAFSFDFVDAFDTVVDDDPVLRYAVYADEVLIAYIEGPVADVGDDGTGTLTLYDRSNTSQGGIIVGQNIENTIGFVTEIPVNQVAIRHEIVSGNLIPTARDPHGLDTFSYSTDLPCDASRNTDSDGDGCPDALEGDASFAQIGYTDLDVNNQIVGGVDADGVPLTASGGQGLGSSMDASTQIPECSPCNPNNPEYADYDGDTVADACDLDDDNDGILDTEEGCSGVDILNLNGVDGSFEALNGVARSDGTLNSDISSSGGWVRGTSSPDSFLPPITGGATADGTQPSPDGGVFGGGFGTSQLNGSGDPVIPGGGESFYADLTGLVIGELYTVSFYQANVGWSNAGTAGDSHGLWKVIFGGNTQQSPEMVFSGYGSQTWQYVNLSFTASATTERLEFQVNSGPSNSGFYSYMGIDGISVLSSSPVDTDNDGQWDCQDTDSDNDGCADANEAYGDPTADIDGNGYFGSGNPPAINPDGTVVGATYSTPVDGNGNAIPDYLETITLSLDAHPQNSTITVGNNTTFTVTTTGVDTYQWQVSTDGGTTYTNVLDGPDYLGTTTAILTLNAVELDKNGYLYRVVLGSTGQACYTENSSPALLSVQVATVITNRRITYRVNKN